jgi:hypothetical protein
MAAPVTFGSMVTSVLRRANIENQVVVGGFISPAEVREYILEGLVETWEKLVKARAQEHMRKSYTFPAIANQSAYPIPADMFELISVDINISPVGVGGPNPQFLNAKPYGEKQRNMFRFYPGLVGWYWGTPVFYRIQGSPQHAGPASIVKNINFIPTPQAAYPINLNYYPNFVPFATDGLQDSYVFDGVSGWEGFAIWNAVAICKAKLKEDGSFAQMQAAKFEERISELASQNDAGASEVVADTEAENDGWYGWSP